MLHGPRVQLVLPASHQEAQQHICIATVHSNVQQSKQTVQVSDYEKAERKRLQQIERAEAKVARAAQARSLLCLSHL